MAGGLLLLAGCAPDAPAPPEWGSGWEAYGCDWAYVSAEREDAWISLRIDLPDEDLVAGAEVAYEVDVAEVDFTLVGPGDGVAEWSPVCSDLGLAVDGMAWEALSGTLEIEARWLGEIDSACDPDWPSTVYEASVLVLDLEVEASDGTVAVIPAFGPVEVEAETSWCAG